MLVLTRRIGEKIIVDESILVDLVSIEKGYATLTVEYGNGKLKTALLSLEDAFEVIPDVYMSVVGISRGQARVGFDAPKSIKIDREEIAAKVKSNQAAVAG